MGQQFADAAFNNILDLVDLERYPIDNLESPSGAAFLRDCRSGMRDNGWCNLEGFIRPEAIDALATEANGLLPDATALTITRNIYGDRADPDAPDGDPAGQEITHHPLQLADDQVPQDTLIQRLYQSDILTDFVRQVQNKPQLYRYGDQFQALNIVALPPGERHGWHYDYNECTVTLLLQAAEQGGDFTFIPESRSLEGEKREIVKDFLSGDMSHAKTFSRDVGTFTMFRGGFSLHGVTRIEGSRPRITAIFTYDEQPGRVAGDEINVRIYGDRAAQKLAAQEAGR